MFSSSRDIAVPAPHLSKIPAPHIGTTLTVGAGLALSTIPSLLPRMPLAQGLLTGVLVLLALTLVGGTRLILAHRGTASRQRVSDPARWLVVAGTCAVLAGLEWVTQQSLVVRSAELGMPALPPTYWLSATAWALLVVGVGLTVGAGVRRLARVNVRRTSVPLVAALLVTLTVTTAAAGPIDLLGPLRKTMDPQHVLLIDSPAGASRSFARVDEARSPEAGARLAVDRMVAEGGLERGAILIALPTGSGWVNREAVTAFETQLDGDVAVVSAQYGDLPSWWSFLIDQKPAMRSARALVQEVLTQVAELPARERPDVYVHGESLGALAGQAAIADVDASALCGVIWSGAPGGEISGHPREVSLHNADDPVRYLSGETALSQPEDWPTTWLPGLSYGTTVLDLGASLLPDAGHGHAYGPEQDWTLPRC